MWHMVLLVMSKITNCVTIYSHLFSSAQSIIFSVITLVIAYPGDSSHQGGTYYQHEHVYNTCITFAWVTCTQKCIIWLPCNCIVSIQTICVHSQSSLALFYRTITQFMYVSYFRLRGARWIHVILLTWRDWGQGWQLASDWTLYPIVIISWISQNTISTKASYTQAVYYGDIIVVFSLR